MANLHSSVPSIGLHPWQPVLATVGTAGVLPGPCQCWGSVGAATWHQQPEGADAALKDPAPAFTTRKRPGVPGAGSIAPWRTGPGRGSAEPPTVPVPLAVPSDLRAAAAWSHPVGAGPRRSPGIASCFTPVHCGAQRVCCVFLVLGLDPQATKKGQPGKSPSRKTNGKRKKKGT